MNIMNKKKYLYLFIFILFSYFAVPSLSYGLSLLEEDFMDSSRIEDMDSLYIAKAKKKKGKKSKKKKGKKTAKKGSKSSKKDAVAESKSSKETFSNSYWGISAGYLIRNVGIIYVDVKKDIFSNIFVYVSGKYHLGCSAYFNLMGGSVGAMYSYRMSDFIEIAGGAGFLVNMFSITDEEEMDKVFVDSSTETTSMMLMYVEPKLSVVLHFTPRIAVVLEAGGSVVAVAGEEVVEKVEAYTGTGIHFGAGAMFTL